MHNEDRFWTRLTILGIILLMVLLVAGKARAQDKTFPLGVVVDSQALFCETKEDAQVVADNNGNIPEELVLTRKCFSGIGRGVYVKEVYRKGEWAVYEFSVGTRSYYEATDYRGIVRGQVNT